MLIASNGLSYEAMTHDPLKNISKMKHCVTLAIL